MEKAVAWALGDFVRRKGSGLDGRLVSGGGYPRDLC